MGWTFMSRQQGISHRDFFKEELEGTGTGGTIFEIVDVAGNFEEVYLAMRITPPGEKPFVTAAVVLTSWRPHDLYNFGYKEMGEEMGPVAARCPRRILDLLSPLEECGYSPDGYAAKWRERCEEYLSRRKALRLKRGTVIRTPKSLQFSGYGFEGEFDTFIIEDPKRLVVRGVYPHDPRMEETWISRQLRVKSRDNLLGSEVVGSAWPKEE